MKSVYEEQSLCCGCAACAYVCPKKAISLQEDSCGFRYPEIDQNLCIDCGACRKVCSFISPIDRNYVNNCYAAQCNDPVLLQGASSGGIFSALAEGFLKDGGLVCGARMEKKNGKFVNEHILIDSMKELYKLQGSKYVQSNLDMVFGIIAESINRGKQIVFSGTPCQNAAMKKVFRKYKDQIFFIDIVCHGVPNIFFFNDYISEREKQIGKEIIEYSFRDKSQGWNQLSGHFTVRTDDRYTERVNNSSKTESFYRLFLDGEIYRDSCYECPYTNTERVGDLTICDYWGIQTYSSELLEENGGPFDIQKGISGLLVNTSRGAELLKKYGYKLEIYPVEIEKVKIRNTQLREPAQYSKLRNLILQAYRCEGYSAVEDVFQKWLRCYKVRAYAKRTASKILPMSLKNSIKKRLYH